MARTHSYAYAGQAAVELAAMFYFMRHGHEVEAIIAFATAGFHAVLVSGRPRRVEQTWRWRRL